MPNTYIVPSGYDVGCDECGDMANFEYAEAAEGWADNHVCAPSDGPAPTPA